MERYFIEGVRAIHQYTQEEIEKAMESGEVLESIAVMCTADMRLIVQMGSKEIGIIHAEDFEYELLDRPLRRYMIANKVGKAVQYIVTGLDNFENQDGTKAYRLSRKKVQQDCFENYVKKLVPGQVIDARVIETREYGAICDIGAGITGMIPTFQLCVSRVSDTKSILKGIKDIKVVVMEISKHKIDLSMREILGTWEGELRKFNKGDTVIAVARKITEHGIFVELTPNLMGLADRFEGVNEGDMVAVYVGSSSPEKMKVKLQIVGIAEVEKDEPIRLVYDIPESGFVKKWVYSPKDSEKEIKVEY